MCPTLATDAVVFIINAELENMPTYPQVDLPHPLLTQFWQIGNSGHNALSQDRLKKQWASRNKIFSLKVCIVFCKSFNSPSKRKRNSLSSLTNCSVFLLLVKWLFLWEIWLLNHHRPLTLTHIRIHTHTYTVFVRLWNFSIDYICCLLSSKMKPF